MADGGAALAIDLFEEGRYAEARTEGLRVLAEQPANEAVRCLTMVSGVRLNRALPARRDELLTLARTGSNTAVRAMAAYEAGRLLWREGQPVEAFRLLRTAFENAPDRALFLRAGCTLHFLIQAHPEAAENEPGLRKQLRTCRPLWDWELQRACMPDPPDAPVRLISLPGRWVVAFYRRQISPAIGMRCSCVPSCSEYFLQACKKHGLLGFPMQADRFYREPSLVSERHNPVPYGNETRYADPLSDHDFWREE